MMKGRPDDEAKGAMKPEQQTGEEFGDLKGGQLNDRNSPERSDTPRGSEPETRSAASRKT